MRAIAVVALAVLLAACASPRRARNPDALAYDGFAVTSRTGLRIVAVQFAGIRRATVTASYGVGAADDPAGKEGLARLVMALTARSRSARGGFSVAERQLAAAAIADTELAADDLEFRAAVRVPKLDEALVIEADRLREPLAGIGDREFADAREGLALQLELEDAGGDAVPVQLAAVVRRALTGTRYDRAAPNPASVRSLTLEDARAWAARFLVPARAVVVVSGPEDPRTAARRALAAFGALAETSSPDRAREAPVPAAAPAQVASFAGPPEFVHVPAATPRIWLAWRLPGDAARSTASAVFAAAALEGVLREHVADDRLWTDVEDVDVTLVRELGASALVARVDVRRGADVAMIRAGLLRHLGLATATDIEERARLAWAGRSPAAVLSPEHMQQGMVPGGARVVRASGASDPIAELSRQLRDQLGPAATAYFQQHVTPAAAAVRVVLPGGGSPPPRVDAPPGVRFATPDEVLGGAAPGRAEVLALVEPPPLAGTLRRRLANGLEVIVVRQGELPVVDARLVFATDPGGEAIATLLEAMAAPVNIREFTSLPALSCRTTGVTVLGDSFVLREAGAPSALGRMLDRLACWRGVAVDGPRFAGAADRFRAALALAEGGPGARAVGELTAGLYGEAHRAPPRREDLARVTAADARSWLATQLGPERALLVVVGKVDPDAAWQAIERRFSSWPARPARAPGPELPFPPSRRVVVLDVPAARVAAVAVGVRLPSAGVDVEAQTALALALRARLAKAVPPRGAALAHVAGRPDAPVLEALLRVPPADTARSVRAALDALRELADTPLPAADAVFFRWGVAGEEAFRFDTVSGTAAAIQSAFVQGRGLEALATAAASVADLTPARIQGAARASALGREVIVVAADAATVAPALRAVGLEPEVSAAPAARSP